LSGDLESVRKFEIDEGIGCAVKVSHLYSASSAAGGSSERFGGGVLVFWMLLCVWIFRVWFLGIGSEKDRKIGLTRRRAIGR